LAIPRSAEIRRTRRPPSEPPEPALELESPPPTPPAPPALVALPSPPELCGIGCGSGGAFFDSMVSSVLSSSDSSSSFFGAFSTKLFFSVSSGDFSFRLAGWEEKSRICNRGANVAARVYGLASDVVEDDELEVINCLWQSLHNVWWPLRRAALQGSVCACPRSMLQVRCSRWPKIHQRYLGRPLKCSGEKYHGDQ
jgi:hypothetical protein